MYMPYVLLGILIKALTGTVDRLAGVKYKLKLCELKVDNIMWLRVVALLSNLLQVTSPSCVKSQTTFEDRSIAANRQRDIRDKQDD